MDNSSIIGSGSQSTVYKGTNIRTGDEVAIKVIPTKHLKKSSMRQLLNGINILKSISSRNMEGVAKLYDVIVNEDDLTINIITELIHGIDIYYVCVDYDYNIPEDVCICMFKKIINIVNKLHSDDIAHLDIKIENIMYCSNTDTVKLIDFCFSSKTSIISPDGIKKNIMLEKYNGSIHYISPEIINIEPYLGKPADMWALGVTYYVMLFGKFPFDDDNDLYVNIFNKIRNCEYIIPNTVSESSIYAIENLLQYNPDNRMTIGELCDYFDLL